MNGTSIDEPDEPERRYVAPHRGAAVLTLGILGLCVCVVCGIIAWVMGNTDMREIREGRMDRAGEGMTNAGRICGMIGVILNCVAIVIWILVMVVFVTHHEKLNIHVR